MVSSTPRPHFTTRKDPLYRRLGGPQGRSGRAEYIVPTGIRSRTVQTVVSRYTYSATGPTYNIYYIRINVLGKKTGAKNIVKEIKQYQKKWLQHVQRMDTNRLPKQALQYKPKGRRNIGRPRKR